MDNESTSPHYLRRRVVGTVAGLAMAMLVGAAVVRSQSPPPAAASASVTKQVQITRGDIAFNEALDGSLRETDTITVLHRIEGETPTGNTASPSTSSSVTAGPSGGGGGNTGNSASLGGAGPSTGGTSSSNGQTTTTQVVTGIAAVGNAVRSGDALYTVESQPVVALRGALPAWRTMSSSSEDGADIAQLETALVALGYDPDGEVTVDKEWDSDTTAMVKRWQAGVHHEVTGEVALGSVVFIAHDATVTSTAVSIGDDLSNGSTVLELSGTEQEVLVDVPAELQSMVQPGLAISLGAATNAITGTVTRLRSAESDGIATVQALITPTSPLDSAMGSTVKVRIAVTLATDELIVPTDAVMSRLDGSYVVEVQDSDGTTSFVPVTIVAVSGGDTAIAGEGLSESTTVLQPA